jgi:hypothetical protein
MIINDYAEYVRVQSAASSVSPQSPSALRANLEHLLEIQSIDDNNVLILGRTTQAGASQHMLTDPYSYPLINNALRKLHAANPHVAELLQRIQSTEFPKLKVVVNEQAVTRFDPIRRSVTFNSSQHRVNKQTVIGHSPLQCFGDALAHFAGYRDLPTALRHLDGTQQKDTLIPESDRYQAISEAEIKDQNVHSRVPHIDTKLASHTWISDCPTVHNGTLKREIALVNFRPNEFMRTYVHSFNDQNIRFKNDQFDIKITVPRSELDPILAKEDGINPNRIWSVAHRTQDYLQLGMDSAKNISLRLLARAIKFDAPLPEPSEHVSDIEHVSAGLQQLEIDYPVPATPRPYPIELPG